MTESELAAMRALLEEHTAETKRHMDVLSEHFTSQVKVIAEGHALLAAKLDSVAAEVSSHTRQFEIVNTEIRVLRADVTDLKRGQAELRQDVTELRQDVTELRQDVAALQQGQSELRQDVTALQQGQAELRQDVTDLRQELAEFRAEVATEFKEVRAQIRLSYSELDQRLHNLEHEVVDLRGRIERIEARFLTS